MDIIDIVLSKKYTDESLKGITGTLAGKNCTIKSATKTDGVTTVVFAWTADDGTEETTTIQVNDGVDGKDTSQEKVMLIYLPRMDYLPRILIGRNPVSLICIFRQKVFLPMGSKMKQHIILFLDQLDLLLSIDINYL